MAAWRSWPNASSKMPHSTGKPMARLSKPMLFFSVTRYLRSAMPGK
jgi:hypothetical protein